MSQFPEILRPQLAQQGLSLLAAGCLLASAAAGASGTRQTSPPSAAFSALPLYFETAVSSPTFPAQFVARTRKGAVALSPTGALLTLCQQESEPGSVKGNPAGRFRARNTHARRLRTELLGANPDAALAGAEELPGTANYFIGNEPEKWRSGVTLFRKVTSRLVYPGIDVIYYGNERQLEYDFVIAPGADPGVISLRLTGADDVRIDERGDLVIALGANEIRQHRPIAYQVADGARREVAAGFRLSGSQTVSFQVDRYDHGRPLVIDPVLSYSTYLGGSDNDTGRASGLDASGNVYVAGDTLSAGLATGGAFQTNFAGGIEGLAGDAFVAKFNNSGSQLLYLTYLGGKGVDAALALALDASGNAYLTGATDSSDFPTRNALSNHIAGVGSPTFGIYPYDAFVAKLDPSGSSLLYSTYLGGNDQEEGLGIAVDAAGCAYVTGFTASTNFPTANAWQTNLAGSSDVFISKLSSNGNALVYSTYLGGTNVDEGNGVAVDSLGRAFVTGFTQSTNFPVMNAFQPWLGANQNAFVAVFGPTGTNLVYSTYLGGDGSDTGFRIALDAAGRAYVTGAESSTWDYPASFPVTPGNLNPGGIFVSLDGGANWQPANTGLLHPRINAVTIDPTSPNKVYAGTGHGLARSVNGGASWDPRVQVPFTTNSFAPPVAVGSVFAVAVNPQAPAMVYAGTYGGLFQSVDFGTNWTLLNTGLVAVAPDSQVLSMAIDPLSPSTVYLGTPIGIYQTTNAAASWNYAAALEAGALAVDPQSPSTVYAATLGAGIYRTSDRGALWYAFDTGITNYYMLALAIDPQTPSTLYAGTTTGIFKTTTRGTNWTGLFLGPAYSNSPVNALAIDPVTTTTVYAGTATGVFKSTDGGATWNITTNGLTAQAVSSLAINPANPQVLYAATGPSLLPSAASDAFLTKLDIDRGVIVFSTMLGGYGTDQGWAVAVDGAGNSYVVGATTSTNFPTAQVPASLSATNSGGYDVFVTAINPDASAFLYSTYLGGTLDDIGTGIAVDPAGNAYITGYTTSANFPTNAALDASLGGVQDGFLAKISSPSAPRLAVTSVPGSQVQVRWPGFDPEYTLETTTNLANVASWIPVPGINIAGGYYSVTLPATQGTGFFRLHRH